MTGPRPPLRGRYADLPARRSDSNVVGSWSTPLKPFPPARHPRGVELVRQVCARGGDNLGVHGLGKCMSARQVFRQELTPVSFLERAGMVHAERAAVVDGPTTYTWKELRGRSRRLASALRAAGLEAGERIAFLAPNSEPLLLAHFGVPQAGGVLVSINVRLAADEIAVILEHSGASAVFCTPELKPLLARIPVTFRQFDTGGDLEAMLAGGSEEALEPWL